MTDPLKFEGKSAELYALANLAALGIDPVRVQVTKVAAVPNPKIPTPSNEEYIPGGGELNLGKSIPVDYVTEGYLMYEPRVGKGLWVLRTKRNGAEVAGDLRTSTIQEIADLPCKTLRTRNSIYILEYLDRTISDSEVVLGDSSD